MKGTGRKNIDELKSETQRENYRRKEEKKDKKNRRDKSNRSK